MSSNQKIEKMDIESEKLEVEHNIGITLRLDWDSIMGLRRIAAFEKEKVAVLCRRIIVEKMQVYERNPAYKRFLKQLETIKK